MFRTYFKSFVSMLIVFTLGFISISNVEAQSTNYLNGRVLNINGSNYIVSVSDQNHTRIASVTDEQGRTTKAIFDEVTGKLNINGYETQIEVTENSTINYARASNKVLKRTTYTIPGAVTSSITALTSALAAISNFPFSGSLISSVISGNLWGKTIKITITEYRSGSKYTSGTHKGKYKYWTNVLVKCGRSTILNQNHSVYYK